MQMTNFPFETVDWSEVERTEHQGEAGVAYWRTRNFGDIRVRIVEYTAGYQADHWCRKGHIFFCLEGELRTELEGGRISVLKPGMSYQVGDNVAPHRSSTTVGAKSWSSINRISPAVRTRLSISLPGET
jgi:quercetin dioxygenase-like cupin family protein